MTTKPHIGQQNANKLLWEKGDFTRIAASMRESGRDIVAGLGITPVLRVLDLGCGDGTTALPAAELGAEVLGVDIAANLVAAGNRRAHAAGLMNLRFEEGDAASLTGLPDDTYDLLVTIFGAMFASQPDRVAAEMVRVTKPGGRIVMGNWIPGDPTLVARILAVCSGYTPAPPEGFVSPMTWGDPPTVVERFGAAGIAADRIALSRETFLFRSDGTPADLLDTFRTFYGPTMNAYAAAAADDRTEALHKELTELFETSNTISDGSGTSIPATYLRVVVSV